MQFQEKNFTFEGHTVKFANVLFSSMKYQLNSTGIATDIVIGVVSW